jgi:hypothetical protein
MESDHVTQGGIFPMSNTTTTPTWLTNTSLKDLKTIRASIIDAIDMTEQENGFLKRINREIEEREMAVKARNIHFDT